MLINSAKKQSSATTSSKINPVDEPNKCFDVIKINNLIVKSLLNSYNRCLISSSSSITFFTSILSYLSLIIIIILSVPKLKILILITIILFCECVSCDLTSTNYRDNLSNVLSHHRHSRITREKLRSDKNDNKINEGLGRDSTNNGCPNRCRCLWRQRKKWTECVNLGYSKIPNDLNQDIQVLDLHLNPLKVLEQKAFQKARLTHLQKILLSR